MIVAASEGHEAARRFQKSQGQNTAPWQDRGQIEDGCRNERPPTRNTLRVMAIPRIAERGGDQHVGCGNPITTSLDGRTEALAFPIQIGGRLTAANQNQESHFSARRCAIRGVFCHKENS